MKILVTGAAGYIGSIVCEQLIENGLAKPGDAEVVALDNLSQGHREAVHEKASLFVVDISQRESLVEAFSSGQVDAVMHFAAASLVEESTRNPLKYYYNNLCAGMNLLETMKQFNVNRLIFSSSAAVYGDLADHAVIVETAPLKPVNPYGRTKLFFEHSLEDCSRNSDLKFVSLRYFNAAGASDRFGEDHRPETHLISNLLRAVSGKANQAVIYGKDYPTRDGTCVRDYVHVLDIAEAHILALKWLMNGGPSVALNIGTGTGATVLEVVESVRRVTGKDFPALFKGRRSGDPAQLVAGHERISELFGWEPRSSDLDRIVTSAWQWHLSHPNGYKA